MSTERSEALVRKWKSRFGLGEFRLTVNLIPHDTPDAWARSFYDIEEMWGVLDVPADDWLPPALLELLVLHELAHGLLQLAASGGVSDEQACNRIARLASGDFTTRLANEQQAYVVGDAWYEDDNEKSTYPVEPRGREAALKSAIDRRQWLGIVADGLPENQRRVIELLYFEGLSLREAGEVLDVAHTTVEDWRDKGLANLRRYFAALEAKDWRAARKVIALRMPEGGAEHGVIYTAHHRCSVANALVRTEVGDEDMDLLIFPVGNIGYGMPKGAPFPVQALDACSACGRDVGAWFVWQAGHSNHPGSIWTPS